MIDVKITPSIAASQPARVKAPAAPRVSLGERSKWTVKPAARPRLQHFYRDVLGCQVISKSERMDHIRIGNNFSIGVVYDEAALSEADLVHSPWLDLRVNNVESLKADILNDGVGEIEYWDKEHFYFQAPGGQVFRLVPSDKDMAKWQQSIEGADK